MNLSEAVARCHQSPRLAGRIADLCRFQFKMDYEETLEWVMRRNKNIDRAKWEALMYEADEWS